MRRLLREPLLHFLVGGALLFALYGTVADDSARVPDQIIVGNGSDDVLTLIVRAVVEETRAAKADKSMGTLPYALTARREPRRLTAMTSI